MTEIQAVIGRYQLKKSRFSNQKRNQIARNIINSLKLFWSKYNLISEPNFNSNELSACIL